MRLIDADALSVEVDKSKHHNPHSQGLLSVNHTNEHDHFIKMIYDAPTVDAVEVVRCKDCEYKRELEGHLVCGDSMRAGMSVDVFEIPTYYFDKIAPDDFCSRGRRKDNG